MIGRQAGDAGMACRIGYDLRRESTSEKRAGKQPSIWAVMAETERDLGSLASDPRWRAPKRHPHSAVWTDDFSDLASCIRWLPWRTSADSKPADAKRIEQKTREKRTNR